MEHRIDLWLTFAVICLLAASAATLHALGPALGHGLLVRQLVWGAAGLGVMWLLSRVRLDAWERVGPVAYGLSLVALIAVLKLGQVRSGTRGWFALGPLTVQPSEFARLGTILMVATWLGRRSSGALSLRDTLTAGGIVGASASLVLLQPDLGVALTYLPILGGALWLGGLPRWSWVALLCIGILAAAGAWHTVLKPYQKERVLTLLDADRDPYGAGYQVRQSKIAIGSGRLSGQGLGHGSQSLLRFLPAQHTDFAFAVWAEAMGFVGSTVLLLAYALLLYRLGLTAALSESRYGIAVLTLVISWLAFQVIVNLGMVVGWLPTTGITLPLFSYGGSSLLSTCAALGVTQSVWRHRLVNQ